MHNALASPADGFWYLPTATYLPLDLPVFPLFLSFLLLPQGYVLCCPQDPPSASPRPHMFAH
jgi:hypothetical protein